MITHFKTPRLREESIHDRVENLEADVEELNEMLEEARADNQFLRQELREAEALSVKKGTIQDAMKAVRSRFESCGLSWSGFELLGTKQSIDEVKRLQFEAERAKHLEGRVSQMQEETSALILEMQKKNRAIVDIAEECNSLRKKLEAVMLEFELGIEGDAHRRAAATLRRGAFT